MWAQKDDLIFTNLEGKKAVIIPKFKLLMPSSLKTQAT